MKFKIITQTIFKGYFTLKKWIATFQELEAEINKLGVKGKAYASDASSFQSSEDVVNEMINNRKTN